MALSTRDKILKATEELVNERGYKGATTKAIAAKAGVNEVTLFRHFGNKKKIVEEIIKKYEFFDLLEVIFENKIVWKIEEDLKTFVREYQQLLEQKRSIILLSIKEAGRFPELDAMLQHIPQKYVDILERYLRQMMKRDQIKKIDTYTVATSFVFMNFGYFLMKTRISPTEDVFSLDDFIEKNISHFIQSLY